jgi:hypothetical protein
VAEIKMQMPQKKGSENEVNGLVEFVEEGGGPNQSW